MHKVLVSVTTISQKHEEKLQEINELNIKEAAFFPTCLNFKQRQEFYKELEKSTLKRIPVVHLRDDMTPEEVEYLKKRFRTKRFNIHSKKQKPLFYNLSKFRKRIYVENHNSGQIESQELKDYRGICLDVSHLEDARLKTGEKNIFKYYINLLEKYKIGFSHVSAIRNKESTHEFKNLSEFDYVLRYLKYLPKYLALELENPIKEQLKAQAYIKKILS